MEKVREIIVKELTVDKEKVTLESRFEEDLAADSLDLVQLLMQLEDQFKISIKEEDQEKLRRGIVCERNGALRGDHQDWYRGR